MRVSVCGAGNGGLAMTADMTFAGHDVTLFELPAFAACFEEIRAQGGIDVCGSTFSGATGTAMPFRLTTEPAEAVTDAEVVMISVVAFGRDAFMQALVPCLHSGQLVVFNTSFWSSLRYQALLAQHGVEPILADAELLMYFASKVGPASVRVFGRKDAVRVAAMPATATDGAVSLLRRLFPCYVPAASVLELGVYNPAALIHTPIAVLNIGLIERLGDEPFGFYNEGATPRICAVAEGLQREVETLGKVLGFAARTLAQFERDAYGSEGAMGTTLYEVESTIRMNKQIAFPARIAIDFAKEDMPYALIPMVRLADQLGIPVPLTSSLVELACVLHERDYWAQALTLADIGLDGLSAKQIRSYALTGKP